MEQFILSSTQDNISWILHMAFWVFCMSIISLTGAFLNGFLKIPMAISFLILCLSIWSIGTVKYTLKNYYKSLGGEYSLNMSNLDFRLERLKKNTGIEIYEKLNITCEESEPIKDCLKKTLILK